MAHFDPADRNPALDLRLLTTGAVSLFWSPAVLDRACSALASLGYHVVRLDARGWDGEAAMYDALAIALDFPGYFGRNLDALNDCLRDVASGLYGMPADATGLVLVLTGYDSFASKEPRAAHAVADIFTGRSGQAMLYGQRMLCLLQSDDPRFTLPPVGAQAVAWNEAEWLNSKRGI